MKPSGAHTHPGMGGGGAALVVLAIIIGAAIVRPVAGAASGLLQVVIDVLEIVLIVIGSAIGLAAAAGLVYLVARLRYQHSQKTATVSRQIPLVIKQSVDAGSANHRNGIEQNIVGEQTHHQPLALDGPQKRLYDLNAGRDEAISRNRSASDEGDPGRPGQG